MKKLKHIALLILMFALKTHSQTNLVPNPSFEDTLFCPDNTGQAYNAVGWNNGGSSPDYYNSCTGNPDVSTPFNWGGYQNAASGVAYCGFATYITRSIISNGREFIWANLTSQLNIGTKYYVSFRANLSLSSNLQSNCASNNLGVLFTINQPNLTSPFTYSISPTINNPNKIIDTTTWSKVFGSFIADSSYKVISFGNFLLDNITDTLILNGSGICITSYYFIDDICVSTDSLFAADYNYAKVNLLDFEKSVKIFPIPTTNYITVKNSNFSNITCEIYDKLSKIIRHFEIEPQSQIIIDLSDLPSGIYCLTVECKNQLQTKKIIKQ